MEFPFGECECDCHSERGLPQGPAAYVVTRGEKSLKVCTRCDLSSDLDKVCLVTGDTSLAPFADFDALGAFCLIGQVSKLSPLTN